MKRVKYLKSLTIPVLAQGENQSLSVNNKIKALGFSDEQIDEMDYVKKNLLVNVYERYNGTGKLLPNTESDENSFIQSVDNIEVHIIGGNNGATCYSGYECKGITVIGTVSVPWNPIGGADDIESVATGAAWSDSWNYLNHEAEVHYGDFFGNPVYKDMTLVDAVPEEGLAYVYSNIPTHVQTIHTDFHVDLRREDGENGTTDAVGKVGYTHEDVIMGASISIAPSINITPIDKVYQKAATASFYY